MTVTPTFSAVREYASAPAESATHHFANRLAVETDVSDVVHDLTHGTGDLLVIDVRAPDDYALCHVPGAINLPHRKITEATTAPFSKSQQLVTYCWGPGCNSATKAVSQACGAGLSGEGDDRWDGVLAS
ncbi:MAG: rhodanese-like domain-containing protein [Gemmatimonadaceae bacterium]